MKETPTECPHCGSADLFTKQQKNQLGLYCSKCLRWIKWVPQHNKIKTMPFGKYEGWLIEDMPIDYIDWLLTNIEIKGSLLESLEEEFERRG